MESNPIDRWPKKDEYIRTVVDEVARWSAAKGNWVPQERERLRRRRRLGLYAAGLLMTAGLATPFLPSFLGNFADNIGVWIIARDRMPTGEGLPERKQIIEQAPQKVGVPSRNVTPVRAEIETPKARTATATVAQIEIAQAAQVSVTEQQQAVERERQRGEALARDLASAREEVDTFTAHVDALTAVRIETEQTLQAAQTSAAELEQALERERRRSEAFARDLASAREEVKAFKAAASAAGDTAQKAQAFASEQKDALERERQRGYVLAQELASAREKVEALMARVDATTAARSQTERTVQAVVTEQKQALEHERQRAPALAYDLTSAREEVETLTARVAATNAARAESLQAVEASAAEQKQAFAHERQRGEALARELTSAREEVEALTARATVATAARFEAVQTLQAAQALAVEQKQALEQERQRSDALSRDVASAREEVEALTAAFFAAIAARTEIARLQAAQSSATEAKQVVEQERQRAAAFEEFDTSDAGSAMILARPEAPIISVSSADPGQQSDPAPHALPEKALRAPSDMVAQAPRERMAARSDPAEAWPRASIRSTSGAPIECLPAALRTVLTDLEKRFGPVTIVSTTHLHTDNHSPGSTRANLHSACKAVDIKTSREPNEVMAYLRSRPDVGGVNTYRNRLVHFDLNANYKRAASNPDR